MPTPLGLWWWANVRFLGPLANATSEIPTYEQLPSGFAVGDFVTANQAVAGTATTAVNLGVALTAGTWGIEFCIKWNSPDAVNTWFSIDYDGTFTGASSTWDAMRIAGSVAHLELQPFNTLVTTSGANPQLITGQGILVATGAGNLGISLDRASSGTSTVPKGCFIKATLM